jgi:L-threonylcarbamoyladenylate synthase
MQEQVKDAINLLKQGEVVAFPTETVYGLGASIFIPEALQKIFTIKGRPSDNPLIVHIASIEEAELLAEDLPPAFYTLAQKFWPGPLTLVVKKRPHISPLVSCSLPTIALRMPSHPIALELIRGAGPLAAPSANLSGRPSPTSAEDVLEDFADKIPLVIDGGKCAIGIESTVISLLGKTPTLLRPGRISREELGMPIESFSQGGAILSPGMKYRHYAPKAKMKLIFHQEELAGGYIVTPRESTLYGDLRKADRLGISEIKVDCTKRLSEALQDRVFKASSIDLFRN